MTKKIKDAQKTEEKNIDQVQKKEPNIDEMINIRKNQLTNIDASIITTQRLIQIGKIKVSELIESDTDSEPLSLTISGNEMVSAMLTPTLEKLYKDRGTLSFEIERLEKAKQNQQSE